MALELFKQIVIMMSNKEHLNLEGFKKILSIRASINKGLSENILNYFPDIVPCDRPVVEPVTIFDPFWILGFVEAEGCF